MAIKSCLLLWSAITLLCAILKVTKVTAAPVFSQIARIRAFPSEYDLADLRGSQNNAERDRKLSDSVRVCLASVPRDLGFIVAFAANEPIVTNTLSSVAGDGDDREQSAQDSLLHFETRAVEPLGLLGSIKRTFADMPVSQRMAVVSSAAGALSVPAYLYNAVGIAAPLNCSFILQILGQILCLLMFFFGVTHLLQAQGWDEEEIARIKAEALSHVNGSSSQYSPDSSLEELHGHAHGEGHSPELARHRPMHRHSAASTKAPGRAYVPAFAVRPRDIAVAPGKDVNIVINFEPPFTRKAAANVSSTASTVETESENDKSEGTTVLSTRGFPPTEEKAALDNALKRQSRTAIGKSKATKEANATVGKLLEYTGLSTTVLYLLAALNSVWRAALVPDSDLQKFRRRTQSQRDDDGIDSIACIPFRQTSSSDDGHLFQPLSWPYVDASGSADDGDDGQHSNLDTLAKRAPPAAAILETAGKHAKTLGIGGIGVTWGFMMHNMGQRRHVSATDMQRLVRRSVYGFDDDTSDAAATKKRNIASEAVAKGGQALQKGWRPGRGSVLFASVLAGSGLAKAGLGVPELHPTVVEGNPEKRNIISQSDVSAINKRGGPPATTVWSTLHRGLNDKVTIAIGSMAASALAVKSGLAGSVIDAIKGPKVEEKTQRVETEAAGNIALNKLQSTHAIASSDNTVEKRQLGKGLSFAVAGFSGVYLAQHTGSTGQQRENRLYKQQLDLERRALESNGHEHEQISGGGNVVQKRGFKTAIPHSLEVPGHSLSPAVLMEELITKSSPRRHILWSPKGAAHSASVHSEGRTYVTHRSPQLYAETSAGHGRGRSVSAETYLDGRPRGRDGFEHTTDQHSTRFNPSHSRSPTPSSVHGDQGPAPAIEMEPDLIEELHVFHHGDELNGVASSKDHLKAKLFAAGTASAGAGALLHHLYIQSKLQQASQKESESHDVGEGQILQAAKTNKTIVTNQKVQDNSTTTLLPDDVLSKTERVKQKGVVAKRAQALVGTRQYRAPSRPLPEREQGNWGLERPQTYIGPESTAFSSFVRRSPIVPGDFVPSTTKHQHVYHHQAVPVTTGVNVAKGGGIKNMLLALGGGLGIGVLGHGVWYKAHSQKVVASDGDAMSVRTWRHYSGMDDTTPTKRSTFNTAVFGALVGTTGAAAAYAWKHDEPGTRKQRHVPEDFLQQATEAEMQQPTNGGTSDKKRAFIDMRAAVSPDTSMEKRGLYSSLAKLGTSVASKLPAWAKTGKAKGIGAIAGGLSLSTTAALMDKGPKEQKEKPKIFAESPEVKDQNVFSNKSGSTSASPKKVVSSTSKADDKQKRNLDASDQDIRTRFKDVTLQPRANVLTPFKALKQLHADLVLHHGKTAGNALIVGGVAASAGATGLLKRSPDEQTQSSDLSDSEDTELHSRGAFGSNVFKMIDVASLAVPAGAIVGGVAGKAAKAIKGKKTKPEGEAPKLAERSLITNQYAAPALERAKLQKRKFIGMSNLGLASLSTFGGSLLAKPIKSTWSKVRGGGAKAAPASGPNSLHVKRSPLDDEQSVVLRRAMETAVLAKKPPTKVLGMSLLSAASMSTMFGFLLAPPLKSAWKKHQSTDTSVPGPQETAEAAKRSSLTDKAWNNDPLTLLSRRASLDINVPNYSDFLDEFLIEAHKKDAGVKRGYLDVHQGDSKRQSEPQEASARKRSLQQTIDYKFGKDGGEFKVSFAPDTRETQANTKQKATSNNTSTAGDEKSVKKGNSLDDGASISTPSTVEIHAHKGTRVSPAGSTGALAAGNATTESEKGVELKLQRRRKSGTLDGDGPRLNERLPRDDSVRGDDLSSLGGRKVKRSSIEESDKEVGKHNSTQPDTEMDKIEYDVSKDSAHFEATFVARQHPQHPRHPQKGRVSTGEETAEPAATRISSGRPLNRTNEAQSAAATQQAALSSKKNTAGDALHSNDGNTSAHERIENKVTYSPSGVTTVTTSIAPVPSKRSASSGHLENAIITQRTFRPDR